MENPAPVRKPRKDGRTHSVTVFFNDEEYGILQQADKISPTIQFNCRVGSLFRAKDIIKINKRKN